MKTIGRIFRRIKFYLTIRNRLVVAIIRTTSERDLFKNALKWNVEISKEDEKYLESRIEIKNEILNQLRNLL